MLEKLRPSSLAFTSMASIKSASHVTPLNIFLAFIFCEFTALDLVPCVCFYLNAVHFFAMDFNE